MISPGSSAVSYRPREEVVGSDRALVRDDRGAQAEHAGRIAGSGVVVGEAAAQGAARAHGGVADAVGELRQRRDRGADLGGGGDGGVGGGRTDAQLAAGGHDAAQLGDAAEVDEVGGRGQAQLHGAQQRLAAGEEAAVFGTGQRGGGLRQRLRAVVAEFVHRCPPCSSGRAAPSAPRCCSALHTRSAVSGICTASAPARRAPARASASTTALTTRGRGADRAELADALDAERVVQAGHRLVHLGAEAAHHVGARQRVVHEACRSAAGPISRS